MAASTPGVGSGGETVVMKFGGTSVADAEHLKRAAAPDRRRARAGQPGRRGALRARARRPTS